MSEQAAADLFTFLQKEEKPLICTASGASPAGLYRELVKLVEHSKFDVSNWYFIGLDEWMGMNGDDEGSSRYQLNEQLFEPLKIAEDRIFFFDGTANAEEQCKQADGFIASHGGITVSILGIGVNGHIAMNEPGTSPNLRSHVTDILPETQAIGQKYFKEAKQIDKGITMGLTSLNESKLIMLLAAGSNKAESIRRMLHETIGTDCPATFLRDHSNLNLYLDTDAASLLCR